MSSHYTCVPLQTLLWEFALPEVWSPHQPLPRDSVACERLSADNQNPTGWRRDVSSLVFVHILSILACGPTTSSFTREKLVPSPFVRLHHITGGYLWYCGEISCNFPLRKRGYSSRKSLLVYDSKAAPAFWHPTSMQ